MNVPAKIPELLTQSLSPQKLERHRAEIGVLAEGTLQHFWQTTPELAVKAVALGQWMDALENYPTGEVAEAMSKWVARETRKPKPADIRALIIEARKSSEPVSTFKTANQRAFETAGTQPREKFDSNAIVAELAGNMREMGE